MDLAIGFFDGVHLGHRRILSQADVALTFAEHPLSVLAPVRAPSLLMTLEERLAAIREALRPNPPCPDSSLGEVERVRALPFTRELAAMPPADFAAMLKRDYPDLGTIFCGPNWNFGANGAGNAKYLQNLGFRVGSVPFEVTGSVPVGAGSVPLGEGSVPVGEGPVPSGEPISSTRIRAALAAGDVRGAAAMLGRSYAVSGQVVSGKGLGGELGFPTINVRPVNPDLRRLLPFGVYVVNTPLGRGIANWGEAPTMGEKAWKEPVLEIHVVEVAAGVDLKSPPASLTVTFEAFVRPERKFASVSELKAQIAKDVQAVANSQINAFPP